MNIEQSLIIRRLVRQDYLTSWQAMKQYTQSRCEESEDEIWLLEHEPVYTQGQNGKPEHILSPRNIPIIQTDRGGQVTYHGPGQLMVYTLIDIKRKKLNVREFVCFLEQAVIDLLTTQHINAYGKRDAPGIYVNEKKIGSIGLRIRKGCAYHGLALNVAMDLEPFQWINPCGFPALKMTQLADISPMNDTYAVGYQLINYLIKKLGYNEQRFIDHYPE